MAKSKTDKKSSGKKIEKNRVTEIANTFEWLITAFVLAFIFRAFIMEAYRIPTGSMADTLMGAHFRLCCSQCGYEYEYGFRPERHRLPQDSIPHGHLRFYPSQCPSCGYYQPTGGAMTVSNGDRILVLKCIYQFIEPRRWDVVVFKNPLEPTVNYIKRLIGRPEETVEIIDGDIYINGKISRKPAKVQQELWMPVYNNDFQPARPTEGSFNGHIWRRPLKAANGSKWEVNRQNPTEFLLDSLPDQINRLIYDDSAGNSFKAAYAYNEIEKYEIMPVCSDLMVRFYVNASEPAGQIGISLSKYESIYKGWVDLTGQMVIAKVLKDGSIVKLTCRQIRLLQQDKPVPMEFANVDHLLILEFGREKLTYDLGRLPEDAGARKSDIMPRVGIFGAGKIGLSHISLFKDIHYTAVDGPGGGRASEGKPMRLAADEYFVLGDNSPSSADSRWWNQKGRGNNGLFYREGIVPHEYLVGKALFVYWPGGFKPFAKSRFSIIPNVGKMRLIYGGSKENSRH